VDPLTYLFGLEKLGIKFGLDNIRTICAALGNPQDAWPSAIIAGTNGKGSVAAMVEAGLRAAGLRTGLYTSPHLVRLEERFAIDGRPVDRGAMVEATAHVERAVERLRAGGGLVTDPTFFEVTTAIAFELFRRAGSEFVVLEVGLGGRFDATNVATPVAGAITTIDLDHERFLGHTIPAIAGEKAGVIKPGMRVVVGERKADAVAVIADACRERGAVMIPAADGVRAEVIAFEDGAAVLDLETPRRRYGPIRLALRGRHQVQNAVVAARLLEELASAGTDVPPDAVGAGLGRVRWPGRLDLLEDARGRRVLCDAAHNPAGARVLAAYLREVYPAGLPIVFGIMKDKDVGHTLEPLAGSASRLVLTRAHTDRALAPEVLAEAAHRVAASVGVDVEPEPALALERAWRYAPTVCAAGSIFLVGEVLAHLERSAAPGSNPLR
jgi:dihydrofolate synthase / folylpolyglutamate synthase